MQPSSKVVNAGYLSALVLCVVLLAYELWQNHLWKKEATGPAWGCGVLEAKTAFQNGRFWLLKAAPIGAPVGELTYDGQYPVYPTVHDDNYPGRYLAEQHVEGFNSTMKRLLLESRATTNAATSGKLRTSEK